MPAVELGPWRRLYRRDVFMLENMFTSLIRAVGEGHAEETPCPKTHRNAAGGSKGGSAVRMAGRKVQDAARHM